MTVIIFSLVSMNLSVYACDVKMLTSEMNEGL
jgi:hypothetical protein